MRPVVRGDCPHDDQGNEIRFSEYQQARRELIRRLGEYCSYCEMHLDASLAVEHVKPKKPPGAAAALPERELDWGNFLLACTNCNSTKGDTDVALEDYLWPDRDDTFHALQYSVGGVIDAAPGVHQAKAALLIKLVGLQQQADTDRASDRRWLNRREAWDQATRAKELLGRCPREEMREQIVMTALAKGFWSVWMTVFGDDPEMVRRFLLALPGTRTALFGI
jgi:uncharacterized protein (TIGR02646 family)